MRRTHLVLGSSAALVAAVLLAWQTTAAPKAVTRAADNSTKAALPLTHVILFSSGVGYFQREGTVDGDARIDMTFRANDVNDLLKSLVLQDLDGGRVSAVSYDSQEPVEKTLKSFALDLTYNPTVGQLLNQARGEKLEVTVQQAAAGQPAAMTGIILGMESKLTLDSKDRVAESDLLNLLCVEGLRTVKLSDIQKLRFLNAGLDAELQRALGVLASSHDSQKKVISLNFKGAGKRRVKVGYVVENPIWKASYRLAEKKGRKKTGPLLQGWALVENTSDEDWKDVKVALVSGRPISFQMDLSQPLFVPRPVVYETAHLANGTSNLHLKRLLDVLMTPQSEFKVVDDPALTLGQMLNSLSKRFSRPGTNPPFYLTFEVNHVAFEAEGQNEPLNIAIAEKMIPAMRNTSLASYLRRILEKVTVPSGAVFVIRKEDDRPLLISRFDERDRSLIRSTLDERNRPPAFYVVEITTGQFALGRKDPSNDPEANAVGAGGLGGDGLGGVGFQGLGGSQLSSTMNPLINRYQLGPLGIQGGFADSFGHHARLTFEQLQQRRKERQQTLSRAKALGSSVAGLDPSDLAAAVSAVESGNTFQYLIDGKITLPRQKSAMLPIVNQNIEAKRVSIYNEGIHAKFPLLGLRFKNTTGQSLMQGPVAIYEDGSYAGDARLMDLQPNEERLLSYAIDLGSEVKTSDKGSPEQLIAVKVTKGIVQATHKLRATRTYTITNRSRHDRVTIVEHPVRSDWKLVEPARASEQSRDVYRFEIKVAAGKTVQFTVVEEQTRQTYTNLGATNHRLEGIFLSSAVVSPKVKAALKKAIDLRIKQEATRSELAHFEKQLKAIDDDQARLRANLDKVPPSSAAYKRYLEKFDKQETQIEKLQAAIQQKQQEEKTQRQEFEDFLSNLTIE